MTNTTSKPSWLYKPIEVPNLDIIQHEFKEMFKSFGHDVFSKYDVNIAGINKSLLEKSAPAYIQFLKEINLYDRWYSSFWAGTIGDGADKCTAHVDCADWTERSFALNIPIQNCHNSYTIWYDVEISEGIENYGLASRYPGSLGFLEKDIKGEIGRLPSTQPAFINVGLPHRPMTFHNEPRLSISTRFSPELFDYFKD
jgi:hypothetical protein